MAVPLVQATGEVAWRDVFASAPAHPLRGAVFLALLHGNLTDVGELCLAVEWVPGEGRGEDGDERDGVGKGVAEKHCSCYCKVCSVM